MFDLRYHVASLAAVFLALAVGILLGVAISGKVGQAEDSFRAAEVARLSDRLSEEQQRAVAAARRGEAAEELLERAYPALMEERLAERRFAVLFLGPVSGRARSAVERTLSDSGSGDPVRMVALDVPLDVVELDEALLGDDELAAYAEEGDDFSSLGEDLGEEFVAGGETPLWSALSSLLVEERAGTSALEVDGAIVVQSWSPPPTDDVDEADRVRATRSLLDGLLRGIERTGFPVVGVEAATSDESTIDDYRRLGISSVDNVDTPAGRLALALLLAGGQPGHYGVKDSASDGVVPPIDSVPPPETGA
ncbi:MAG: copper transporter [Gaiellales bacterium]